jgi:1-acyl-sn-glycerol-3-phosphate acyltransferase
MFANFRARHPGGSIFKIALWASVHFVTWLYISLFYRFRVWGGHRLPRTGPVLIISNHQSFLDPMLIGAATPRRQFFSLARATLFSHPGFGWVIRLMNAVPVERGAADMSAMRRCIDVLKQGHALVIYPEGTRTKNGTTGSFASGMMFLVKRASPDVVPIAIEGAFDVWPRTRKIPRLTGQIGVMIGQPIPAQVLLDMDQEAALKHLQQTVEDMRVELRRMMHDRWGTDPDRQPPE